MILLTLILQVQVDWRVWLYGMRPGKTLGSDCFMTTPHGFLLGVGLSRPYLDPHAVAWALTHDGYTLWQFHQDTVSYDWSVMCSALPTHSGIYTVGSVILPGADTVFSSWVLKLNPFSGLPIWSYILDSLPDNGSGVIAMDPTGNLIIKGSIEEPATSIDILVFSLDTSGNLRWYFRYDGPFHRMDQAHDLSVDGEGNSYMVGFRTDIFGSCPMPLPLAIKLDTTGNPLWIRAESTMVERSAEAMALFGEWLYMSGSGTGTAWLTRLDTATGNTDWIKEYVGPVEQSVSNMAVDKKGNLYLTGGGGPDCWEIMCVDTIGNEKWKLDVNPGWDSREGARLIALDSLGNIFIGGTNEHEYPAVYKLDTSGNLIWAWTDTLREYSRGTATGLVPDGHGGVYAQEWFTKPMSDPPYYTSITSVVHLTEAGGVAGNTGAKPGLRITMAPSGFYITCPSGEARIYDSAGRLVIRREIKGKTLISPLVPGVYFVVAGDEKAKVTVR
ncbi:MAG: hypothetical protein ABIN66_05940 [candidate division WOR-3 bacterium]